MGRLRDALAGGGLAAIAEIKRRSPSAGDLRPDADPAVLATSFEQSGAAAVSVLVDERFGGTVDDLGAARSATRLPLLAKGFFAAEAELRELRGAGADGVLLLLRDLDDEAAARLQAAARELGMDALVEAHEPEAFARAVRAEADTRDMDVTVHALAVGTETLLGVNARDLRQPSHLDRGRIHHLAPQAQRGPILVAESGITSVEHAEALPLRVDAVLVGTALVTSNQPGALVHALSQARPGRALA